MSGPELPDAATGPSPRRRVAIVGPPGAGTSSLAATLAEAFGLARIELDELFHRPGREPPTTPEFRRIVADALGSAESEHGGWVVAGGAYLVVADLTHGRADTIVWLDLTRPQVVWRTTTRSLGRVLRREPRWNGDRETLRRLLGPRRSMLAEAWRTHPVRRAKLEQLSTTPLWASADVHRLRTPAEIDAFVLAETGD